MSSEQTERLKLAAQFVNSTSQHIFLTGKAGTGKTTFLRDLAMQTHKRFIIVAPTGIAALNAQGVTIHSQFLLPFGSFIPENQPAGNFTDSTNFYTQYTLTRKHPINSVRKQVLRAADLIIIDEVSMLRADILDAIDFRLRSVKRNYSRSFGGVQVLMIGDLYQLPPIVKDYEWNVLRKYYASMHFFEAKALRQEGMVYIELDKIFRQKDHVFIQLLNSLRNNVATRDDIDTLNNYYRSKSEIDKVDGVITITTHNYKADAINKKELEALPGPSSFFDAEITGDFPEHLFPLPERIELKTGAQVMFIKNDSSGERIYYNGMLARVDLIDKEGITVVLADSKKQFVLRKETWENKKYTIDSKSKELEEDIIGTFEQYPIKLAWAVTVHKSQGLTFDKAIIDVGQAFAPGQVYVALSRLRSLDGLILRTRINTSSISSDQDVVEFTQNKQRQRPLDEMLKAGQKDYLQSILIRTFDFTTLEKQLDYFKRDKAGKLEFEDESMRMAMDVIRQNFDSEKENTRKFRDQLMRYLHQNDYVTLLDRIQKGSAYYGRFMEGNIHKLLVHQAEVEQFTRTKTYLNALAEIDQLLMKALEDIEHAPYKAECVIKGNEITRQEKTDESRALRREKILEAAYKQAKENPKLSKLKSGRTRKKSKKKEKGQTYAITFELLKEGKTIEDVAAIRSLTTNTIQGHIARGIKTGDLNVFDYIPKKQVDEISGVFRQSSGNGIIWIFKALNGKYDYGLLRMVQAYLIHQKANT